MAESHFIPADHTLVTLDRTLAPVLDVTPPCEITFETSDSTFRRLLAGETMEQIGLHNFNVATGPVFVRGAEPGDALRVEVRRVEVTRAWTVWMPGMGPLGGRTDRVQISELPLRGDQAVISDRITVDVDPMIGVIALAPATGSGSTVFPAYPWGGNMDLRELSPGAVILLPVQVPGALLTIGDLHAAMGASEPMSVALEAVGKATVHVSLNKGLNLPFPRLRVKHDTIFMAMAESLPEAKTRAVNQAFDHLTGTLGLSPADAYAYACARLSLRLGGPASPMALAVLPDFGS